MKITNAMMQQFISELEYEAENGIDVIHKKRSIDLETYYFADGRISAFKQIAERLRNSFKIVD